MGRPRKQNPKNRHIGIVTTEEKFRRYKALGLVGDEAIDALLYHMENDKTSLNVQKMQIISNIKNLENEIKDLESRKKLEEERLKEVNEKIGVNEENGLQKNVDRALNNVLQRYARVQDIYDIYDFMDMNMDYIKAQAYLANCDIDEFKGLIHEHL